MTFTPQTILGQRLCTELSWMVNSPGTNPDHLMWYFDCVGALFEPTATLVTDSGDGAAWQSGYGALFTPNPRFPGDTAITPTADLPFIAQFAGVTLPEGADDATMRSLITEEAGQQRGRPSAIVAAVKRYLSGTQTVYNLQRQRPDGTLDSDWFTVVVLASEVTNASALIAAVEATKPSWLQWTLIESTSGIWSTDNVSWSSDISGTWLAS